MCRAPGYEVDEDQATFRSVWDGDQAYNLYSPFCYLNHDNDPNADLYLTDDGWELYFLRHVAKDEEVTIDYGFDPSEPDDDTE